MKVRKIIFNIFIFAILIGSFLYYYINSNTIARAEELRLCVKGIIVKDPVTGKDDYSRLNFNDYITITYPNNTCPTGYAMMPAGFNLNLFNIPPTPPNFLGGGNSSTSSTSSNSGSGSGQNNPSYNPSNPYSDLYNELNDYLNNGNYGNGSSGNGNSGSGYGSGNGYGDYGSGNGYGDSGSGGGYGNYGGGSGDTDLGSALGNGNIVDNPYNGNEGGSPYGNGGSGSSGGGSSGSGSGGGGDSDPYQVNPNPVIQVDPKLAIGRFEALDSGDYKYCVLLTRNMSPGANDSNTGKEVSALQMYLYDRGYLDIPANGNYDQNTALAVAKFQYRNQIEVSGIVKADVRGVLKELTCIKYPVISYVSKPISPAPTNVKITPTPSTNNSNSTPKVPAKPAPAPSKPSVPIIELPPTTTEPVESGVLKGSLSQVEGNMYLSKGNVLYFTYNTKSTKSYICLSLNNTDCSNTGNYAVLDDGVMMNLYEVVRFSNFWAFSLYNSQIWGAPGDKARIYLKDNLNSKDSLIYIVNILN